jgi:peptidoglycan/LPS O-acetylase OafA/YrhL
MKKAVIVLIIASVVLITTGIWYFSSASKAKISDLIPFGIIIILVGFAVFVGYKKLSNARRGEPTEDELSKKVLQKASSLSYYISLYMWLALIYFSDRIKLETSSLIGAGILGMAVIFFICWGIINFTGIKNE